MTWGQVLEGLNWGLKFAILMTGCVSMFMGAIGLVWWAFYSIARKLS